MSAGLVVRYGARRLDLDTLPPGDAVALLRALIGERVDAEPDAAMSLAGQCARLPLALRIAAELAATSPVALLRDLVGELADGQRRLRLLDAGGDPRSEVRACCRGLTSIFRLLLRARSGCSACTPALISILMPLRRSPTRLRNTPAHCSACWLGHT